MQTPFRGIARRGQEEPLSIVLGATFPPGAIGRSLSEALLKASIPARVDAGWGEDVVHQLWEPDGKFARNFHGVNIVLVRLDDWNNFEVDSPPGEAIRGLHRRRALDRSSRLEFLAHNQRAHFILCVCPYAKEIHKAANRSLLAQVEEIFTSELDQIEEIKIVKLTDCYVAIEDAGSEGEDGYVHYAPEVIDLITKQLLESIREIIGSRPEVHSRSGSE